MATRRKSIYQPDYISLMTMLRKKREESGMTQEAIAAALGITQSQLSKWERRDRRVDLLEILRYCQALKIPLSSIIAEWEPTVAPLEQQQASGSSGQASGKN